MDHGDSHIGVHHVVEFAGLAIHLDTMYMTWITNAVVLLIAVLATRNIQPIPVSRWQGFIEMIAEGLLEQITNTLGAKGKQLAPLLITLFIFLVIANWLGLVPGFVSPTADLNTTLGLAVMISLATHVVGMTNKGVFPHLSHLFQPSVLFFPINLVEEFSKPITLAARLFGNIMAGEILLMILNMLVPYLIPMAWVGFSICVGIVQALVFTIMSISYFRSSFEEAH